MSGKNRYFGKVSQQVLSEVVAKVGGKLVNFLNNLSENTETIRQW